MRNLTSKPPVSRKMAPGLIFHLNRSRAPNLISDRKFLWSLVVPHELSETKGGEGLEEGGQPAAHHRSDRDRGDSRRALWISQTAQSRARCHARTDQARQRGADANDEGFDDGDAGT